MFELFVVLEVSALVPVVSDGLLQKDNMKPTDKKTIAFFMIVVF